MTSQSVAAEGITSGQWAAALDVIQRLPSDASVLLVCHVNPDGDAIGSMLGVGLGLRGLGFQRIQATFPGPMEVPEPFQIGRASCRERV